MLIVEKKQVKREEKEEERGKTVALKEERKLIVKSEKLKVYSLNRVIVV